MHGKPDYTTNQQAMAISTQTIKKPAQAANVPAGSAMDTARTYTRRKRRSRPSYHHQVKIRRYKFLIAGIVILFLLIYIFTLLHFSGESNRHQQNTIQLRKLETSLGKVTTELEKVRSERDAMVKGRIPDLSPLRFDEAIPIGENFIRNVIFTLVRNGNTTIYEYRLVLSNEGLSVIRPEVEIFLFNELGIQIGNAHVQAGNATTNVSRVTLEPGEVRSYSDTIDMVRQGEPMYFLINSSNKEKPESDALREHLGDVVSP